MTFSRPQDLVPLAVKWISHSGEASSTDAVVRRPVPAWQPAGAAGLRRSVGYVIVAILLGFIVLALALGSLALGSLALGSLTLRRGTPRPGTLGRAPQLRTLD